MIGGIAATTVVAFFVADWWALLAARVPGWLAIPAAWLGCKLGLELAQRRR